MRYFVITIMFLLSLVLQSTLFSHLTVAGVKPDLVLIFIIFYALFHGPAEGALAGLIGGLLQDLLFGLNIGMNSLVKALVGYIFGVLERKIYKENILIPMAAVFAGTFLSETLLYAVQVVIFLMKPAGQPLLGYFEFVKDNVLSTALYNACLIPFFYKKFYLSLQKGLLRVTDR